MVDVLASSLTLTELAGQDQLPRSFLELRGGGLPFQKAEWEGEHRLATRWPAGSASGTQHVLGPREMPSEWEGMWRRTMLGREPCLFSADGASTVEVVDPAELRDIVDNFRVRGTLLRVVWAASDRQHVARVGRISKAKFPHTRATDIEWRITFDWIGFGDSRALRVIGVGDAFDELEQLRLKSEEAANALIVAADEFRTTATGSFTLSDLESIAAGPLAFLQGFADQAMFFGRQAAALERLVGELAGDVAGTPAATAKMALDLAAGLVTDFARATDTWTAIPGELVGSTGDSLSSLVTALGLGDSAMRSADEAIDRALDLAAKARGQAGGARGQSVWDPTDPDPRAILAAHVARAGETFASIAQRFYASADRGAALAAANGLPAYQISPAPGSVVLVPQVTALPEI